MINKNDSNYNHLIDEAEAAFYRKEYLAAFMMQSCIMENILKKYALIKLPPVVIQNSVFMKKFKDLNSAALVDALFVAGKITERLYEDLNIYRKQRNNVVHSLLDFDNLEKLNKDLQLTYGLGKLMKGFIMDTMNIGGKPPQTINDLMAEISTLQAQIAIFGNKETNY